MPERQPVGREWWDAGSSRPDSFRGAYACQEPTQLRNHVGSVPHPQINFFRRDGAPSSRASHREPHAAYSNRIAETRRMFRSRQRFFEFCVSCGDDIFTLARAFGMNTTRLLQWLPEGEIRPRQNALNDRREDVRVHLLKTYASTIV